MLDNLGELFGKVVRIEVNQVESHEDVSAWHAPSECHGLVARGYDQERKDLDKWFIENYSITTREVIEEAEERTGICEYMLMSRCVSRLYVDHFA